MSYFDDVEGPVGVGIPTTRLIGPVLEARLRTKQRPNLTANKLIASDAYKCARAIGLRVLNSPRDVSYTDEDRAAFGAGDFVDTTAKEVFAQQRNAAIDVPFDWGDANLPIGGKADSVYKTTVVGPDREDDTTARVVAEVKSTSPGGYRYQTGGYSAPAHPKVEWVLQAGLAACSPTFDADYIHIVLVDRENLVSAEWLIGVDDPQVWADWDPDEQWTVRQLVESELGRQTDVLMQCDHGTLPAREVPGFGLVLIPPGRDEPKGKPWNCVYCPWQPTCAVLAPEAVPVNDLPVRI